MIAVGEVAAIREQIAAEHMAAKLGLEGLSYGTSRHAFITAKQENIGALHKKLQGFVGDNAIALVAEVLDSVPDIPARSDILAVLRHELDSLEELEPLCNALQEAWRAVDLLRERLGDGRVPMDLENWAAFAGVDLLKERFGDQAARKMILAPSSSVREIPPS
jgi:hypothetical protein